MKHFKMKIKPYYIKLIKENYKKHEYRLADDRYKNIKVNDVLILVSNQDKNEFVKVIVESIKEYPNWEEALKNNWKEDFNSLFDSFDKTLKECFKFYQKWEIDKYGIIVFKIKPYHKDKKYAKYLFDTNVIIDREDSQSPSKEVALCYQAIDAKLRGDKYVDEYTINEIKQCSNKKLRESMLTKLNAYQKIKHSLEKTDEFDKICSKFSNNENSQIDNELLLQVYNGNVDFLITSDNAIIEKAKMLYINDSVFSPNSFLNEIKKEYPELIDYNVLSIKKVKISDIDINDKIFDSLREDYPRFDNWLLRKRDESAYIFKENNKLQAFLYIKKENENEKYSDFVKPFAPG